MELKAAQRLAWSLRESLAEHCTRIEIAGSVRREKPEVKDIEIVAAPKYIEIFDLFNNLTGLVSDLDGIDWREYGGLVKNGSRYKQIWLRENIHLDLFCVLPPAQWGVLYTLRTGPQDFSQWVVTAKRMGGALPWEYRVKDGAVRIRENEAVILPTPEEVDFFKLLGLRYMDPWERQAQWRYAR